MLQETKELVSVNILPTHSASPHYVVKSVTKYTLPTPTPHFKGQGGAFVQLNAR